MVYYRYFCYLLGRYQELNQKIEGMETQLENCDSQIRRLEDKVKLDKEKLMEIRKLEQQVEVSFFSLYYSKNYQFLHWFIVVKIYTVQIVCDSICDCWESRFRHETSHLS